MTSDPRRARSQGAPKITRFEFRRLDPLRWAILHVPVGFATFIGLCFATFRSDEVLTFTFLAFVILAPAVVVPLVCLFAAIQASILNLYIALLRRGPIFDVREVSVVVPGTREALLSRYRLRRADR